MSTFLPEYMEYTYFKEYALSWKSLAKNLLSSAGSYLLWPKKKVDSLEAGLKRLRKLSLASTENFPSWLSCRDTILTALVRNDRIKVRRILVWHYRDNRAMISFLHRKKTGTFYTYKEKEGESWNLFRARLLPASAEKAANSGES